MGEAIHSLPRKVFYFYYNLTHIYCLEKNGIPFYIGKTINLKKRMYSHKKRFGNFDFISLHECDDIDTIFWEAHYYWQYRSFGFKLLNIITFSNDISGKIEKNKLNKMKQKILFLQKEHKKVFS